MNEVRPKRRRIAAMEEPESSAYEAAIVVMVYEARHRLSEAERALEDGSSQTEDLPASVSSALKLLHGATALLKSSHVRMSDDLRLMMDRAMAATMAAEGQVLTSALLRRDVIHEIASREPSQLETNMYAKMLTVARASVRAAKQEAHRSLALLADEFPDAYSVDEVMLADIVAANTSAS